MRQESKNKQITKKGMKKKRKEDGKSLKGKKMSI